MLMLNRKNARILAATLILTWTGAACGADTYNAGELSMPRVAIGGATYSNMVVTVGSIVSGPSGTGPYGVEDRYDPGSKQLTVQAVTAGSATYYNVVVTVADLISIGGVAGADTYDGSELAIAYAQVLGGSLYTDVVISGTSINSVAGGMPALIADTYDAATRQLTIPAVQVGSHVYTNVTITVGTVESTGDSP